ncbi:MAG: DNA-3-methyladenine glycosylase [Phycisphaerales bacterium]
MKSTRCSKSFFARDADAVARDLLGCLLVRIYKGERLAGRIVETEAYLGVIDQASHASNNRRTLRNEAMYGPPGLSYVYFTYGMHFCMNVSCKAKDDPAAVLIRALEPVDGLDTMRDIAQRREGHVQDEGSRPLPRPGAAVPSPRHRPRTERCRHAQEQGIVVRAAEGAAPQGRARRRVGPHRPWE